jgi:hypothetical protein
MLVIDTLRYSLLYLPCCLPFASHILNYTRSIEINREKRSTTHTHSEWNVHKMNVDLKIYVELHVECNMNTNKSHLSFEKCEAKEIRTHTVRDGKNVNSFSWWWIKYQFPLFYITKSLRNMNMSKTQIFPSCSIGIIFIIYFECQ